MPYTREHKQRTRKRIVESARRLFNLHGFAGVSIDEIMADAGLTRGGFYNHFDTKEELYAEVVTHALACRRAEAAASGQTKPPPAREFVSYYLSQGHFDNRETCCPLLALPSDIARSSDGVKRAYRQVLEAMISGVQSGLGWDSQEARRRALALAVLCVGGMVMARAVDDASLAQEIREAAKDLAISVAGRDQVRLDAAE
jgi:AcrR family transcriptional regulator